MRKTLLLWVVLLMIGALVAGCGSSDKKEIVVGGKNFTEQDIMVELLKQTIEKNTDIKVKTKPFLGGTNVVAAAIERGDLDMYVEYTGTALLHILKVPLETDSKIAYEKVKSSYESQKQILWLKPLGFNNTYTITMREDKAKSLGVETISDLVPFASSLTFACTAEFIERPDGYPGLQKAYGIKFKSVSTMDPGLTYNAVRDGSVDVIDAFATDGRIPAFQLKVLKDDRKFFPPYEAVPIIRIATLKRYPELQEVVNRLAGKLTDAEMAKLNAQVDVEKKSPEEVVNQWLKKQNLIK